MAAGGSAPGGRQPGDDLGRAPGTSDEVQVAGDALSQVLVEREVARLADSRARLAPRPGAWQEAAIASQSMMWLTAEELAEIEHSS